MEGRTRRAQKLDKNDDELVGAGELVPKTVYLGAAGTILLTPPSPRSMHRDVIANLPLVLLPTDQKDATWAAGDLQAEHRSQSERPACVAEERGRGPLGDQVPPRQIGCSRAIRIRRAAEFAWTAGSPKEKSEMTFAAARKQLVAQPRCAG